MFSNKSVFYFRLGPGVALWLRRCAPTGTVPGSIPGGVNRFFSDISPSDRSMALGLTQPIVKMSTRNFPGVKVAGAWGWQPCQLRVPNVMKCGSLNLLEHSGPVTGLPLFPIMQHCCTMERLQNVTLLCKIHCIKQNWFKQRRGMTLSKSSNQRRCST
jgi:hypothetical protein